MVIRLVPSIITVTVSLVVAQQKLELAATTLSQTVNVRLNHMTSLAAFVKTN